MLCYSVLYHQGKRNIINRLGLQCLLCERVAFGTECGRAYLSLEKYLYYSMDLVTCEFAIFEVAKCVRFSPGAPAGAPARDDMI